MKKLFILFFFVVCFFNSNAQIGVCDSIIPTFCVDFTGRQTDSLWTSPPVIRDTGYCCSIFSRCVQFIIASDSNTCGFIFIEISGPDPGSYDLWLCCGSELPANDTVYLSPGIHSLAFCKPGISLHQYQIRSVTSCAGTAPPDSSCGINCSLITKTKDDFPPKTISVYPNPVANRLTVQFSETLKGNISFQIYDVTGREVLTQPQTSNLKPQTIDVSSLQAGVYFLKMNDGKRTVVKRFLKE